MEFPAETLRALIQSNWSLTTAALEKIKFARFDWNITGTPFDPHVVVLLVGMRRLQPAEDIMYEFTFIVKCVLQAKTLPNMDETQDLHWTMVEEVKRIVETASTPSGWEQVGYIQDGANVGEPLGLLPEQFAFNLQVKATIAWSVQ